MFAEDKQSLLCICRIHKVSKKATNWHLVIVHRIVNPGFELCRSLTQYVSKCLSWLVLLPLS